MLYGFRVVLPWFLGCSPSYCRVSTLFPLDFQVVSHHSMDYSFCASRVVFCCVLDHVPCRVFPLLKAFRITFIISMMHNNEKGSVHVCYWDLYFSLGSNALWITRSLPFFNHPTWTSQSIARMIMNLLCSIIHVPTNCLIMHQNPAMCCLTLSR